MNVILSERTASCVVKCPWQIPSERNVWFSRIELSERLQKRQLGKAKRKESYCVVKASVWSPAVSSNGIKSKSFRRESLSECVIEASTGPGRLIGIGNAIDCTLYVEFTWVLVAIRVRNGVHRIALLRFERDGIKLHKIFSSPETPLDGVVLRGPHVLFTTSKKVLLQGLDGKITCEEFGDRDTVSGDRHFHLCPAGNDLEAVIAAKGEKDPSQIINVRTIRSSGLYGRPWTVKDVKESDISGICVSPRLNIFALGHADGSIRCFNIKSGLQLWRTSPRKELENPASIGVHGDNIVVVPSGSETVWCVPTVNPSERQGSNRIPKLLFPEICSATSEGHEHGHFFALWRQSLLQVSDKSGAFCTDMELSIGSSDHLSNKRQGAPLMHAVSRKLERRLDAGVERVTDAAQRQEEKLGMLNHLRSLLAQAAGEETRVGFARQFHEALDEVIVLSKAHERGVDDVSHDHAIHDNSSTRSTRVFMGGSAAYINSSQLVQLLESKIGVDKSGRFVLIQVRVSVPNNLMVDDDPDSASHSLRLRIQFDRCIAAIWDVEAISRPRIGDRFWVRACTPIAAILANSVTSVEALRVVVRADSNDGHSQYLGTFSLCDILSSVVQFESGEGNGNLDQLLTFTRSVHAVAQGPSAGQLQQRLRKGEEVSDSFKVITRERLACIRFSVSSNIELALAIAKIRASLDDRVCLRSAGALSESSLTALNLSLRRVEDEMQAVRNVAGQRGVVGYDLKQIENMLKRAVD